MSFVVEDGTGVDGANAYVDVTYVDDYFTDRANAAWTGATNVKQAAIIKATDYIEARFGTRFLGEKKFTDQDLSWPRKCIWVDGVEIDPMPDDLKKATSEYAVRALTADLWNEPEVDPVGRVVVQREKVGPIEEDRRYAFNRDVSVIKPVPAADRLLTKYTVPAGFVYR